LSRGIPEFRIGSTDELYQISAAEGERICSAFRSCGALLLLYQFSCS
jgi:hypothetical protein